MRHNICVRAGYGKQEISLEWPYHNVSCNVIISCMLYISIYKLVCCWLVYKQINKQRHHKLVIFTMCSLNNHNENVKIYIVVIRVSTTQLGVKTDRKALWLK